MPTDDATAFSSKEKSDGTTHTLFNGPGDGDQHGHVIETLGSDGQTTYNYARDVEGNVYADDKNP